MCGVVTAGTPAFTDIWDQIQTYKNQTAYIETRQKDSVMKTGFVCGRVLGRQPVHLSICLMARLYRSRV